MKRNVISFFSAALAVLTFVSCGSAPKAPAKVVTPVEEAAEKVAENEEAKAVDNSSALGKAETARAAAVEAGADKSAAEQFAVVDALYQSLRVLSESGKDVSGELAEVQLRFSALEQYAKALDAKKKIDEYDFSSYDKTAYDSGCASLSEMDRLFVNPDASGGELFAAAGAARSSFDKVLLTAFKKLSKDERVAAFNAKRSCDGVKAGVSAKTEYSVAVEEFRAGDSSYAMQNPESAFNHYKKSKALFSELFNVVSARREAAQKSIDEAKAKVLESQNYAVSADEKAPLSGDDVKGIEAADTILLEPDEYADPSSQEADIPEVMDDSAEADDSVQEVR